ncbi:FHA domain-containing protein [Glycomyces sp. NPDC047369]|uniref:Type III secretion system (T3SS) inner membrane Yop/YscD-like protein n=2 Tax=Glycomyces artemisiae TaxID=1076443 RepID=A0A2T0UMF7_9ACTN|nr:FHA domain-containing protein [Glycomyces artemisiae]PRY59084.1 type III secretion system (T3SS) inner membrane Yop/YscD-like protein [Glycomyces artemisiae]
MPEIVQTVARFGFLVLLWLFVFAAARTITRDLLAQRRPAAAGPGAGPVSAPPAPGRGAAPQQAQAAQWLVVTTGELQGRRFVLSGQPISIGRAADSTIVIRDDFASNRHARVRPLDGQWVVEDMGSTNGTYLGRARVTAPTPVPLGVPIRIGRSSFELRP